MVCLHHMVPLALAPLAAIALVSPLPHLESLLWMIRKLSLLWALLELKVPKSTTASVVATGTVIITRRISRTPWLTSCGCHHPQLQAYFGRVLPRRRATLAAVRTPSRLMPFRRRSTYRGLKLAQEQIKSTLKLGRRRSNMEVSATNFCKGTTKRFQRLVFFANNVQRRSSLE